jgi:tetratricopeptide (TPR) repeat protein
MHQLRILIPLLFFSSGWLFSQKTMIYTHVDRDFREAWDLYQKEKYEAARAGFEKAAGNYSDPGNLVRVDAEFLTGVCAVELFNKDAEWLLQEFISKHPESGNVLYAYLNLGNYNFRKKRYKDVIKWLEKVDPLDLQTHEREEYHFYLGYAWFEQGNASKSRSHLAEIKDNGGKYAVPARYYYAHMDYADLNLESSLKVFRSLTGDPDFGPVVPYYISHILFMQKKYEEVVSYAPPLLKDTANAARAPEISRIVGESFFRLGDFKEAIPYLEKYRELKGVLNRSESYQLGYSYYRVQNFSKALVNFRSCAGGEDSLSQNTYYHMGDCFVKQNEKQKAADAFYLAYKIGLNQNIREDALFNYAKLSYELSYSPFNEAIKAFENYLNDYPNSNRKDEAFGYLVNVYYNTKNYEAALASIEKINNLPPKMKAVHQKLAYLRGLQLYNDKKYTEATDHFNKSLKLNEDKEVSSLSMYWKANCLFFISESGKNPEILDQSTRAFKAFLFEPGASNTPYFNLANYDLGYCYLRKGEFQEAALSFRKYLASKPASDGGKKNDALLRTADCYMKLKDYPNASDFYSQSIEMSVAEVDYALFQNAMALGYMKKPDKKIENLEKLVTRFKGKSPYEASGLYELALSFSLKDENDKAFAMFKRITDEFPKSNVTAPSLLQMGNILNKQKKYDDALVILEKVIDKYPKTFSGLEAVQIITEICKNKKDMECLDRVAGIPWANVSKARVDSNAFQIARDAYLKENYTEARMQFGKYLQKHPDGIFVLDATFYKAECDMLAGDQNLALGGYVFVIDRIPNKFGEVSLAKASSIYFKNNDFERALKNYQTLEQLAETPSNLMNARVGQMRCHFNLNNWDGAIEYGNKVLNTDKTGKELFSETKMIIGKSAMAKGENDMAWKEFAEVIKSGTGERPVEAKYLTGEIKFLKGEFKESQKILFELINQKPPYSYWIGKSFILISDNYVGLNDLFNAKFTLNTFIEKSTNEELLKIAREKLAKVLELEKELENKNKRTIEDPFKVEFRNQPVPVLENDSIQKK